MRVVLREPSVGYWATAVTAAATGGAGIVGGIVWAGVGFAHADSPMFISGLTFTMASLAPTLTGVLMLLLSRVGIESRTPLDPGVAAGIAPVPGGGAMASAMGRF